MQDYPEEQPYRYGIMSGPVAPGGAPGAIAHGGYWGPGSSQATAAYSPFPPGYPPPGCWNAYSTYFGCAPTSGCSSSICGG